MRLGVNRKAVLLQQPLHRGQPPADIVHLGGKGKKKKKKKKGTRNA